MGQLISPVFVNIWDYCGRLKGAFSNFSGALQYFLQSTESFSTEAQMNFLIKFFQARRT